MAALCCAGATRADVSAPSQPPGDNIRGLLLFPLANGAGASAQAIAPMIDDAIQLRLASVNKFKVTRYSRRLPSVQVALQDRDLTSEDTAPPFGDSDKDQPRAAKIAARMDVDAYFVGDLDSYTVDPVTKTVTLQITGSVYMTQSGVAAKSVGTSVTAKPETPSDQIDTVVQYAVDDAAGQIVSSINSIPQATPVVASSPQHSSSIGSGSILLAVLGGALLYAALHHDNSSSGGGGGSSGGTGGSTGGTGGVPPPPPPP
jgi:hypothetical protein